MTKAWQQTGWLTESLPKCASTFRNAGERGFPDWVIVQFHVEPALAELKDMRAVSEIFPTRTKALIDSKLRAKSIDPSADEKGHMGVWRINSKGKTLWQTVVPNIYLPR